MDNHRARALIQQTFENPFDEQKFKEFIINLFKDKYELENGRTQTGRYIPEPYQDFVSIYKRILKYNFENKRIDVLIVQLEKNISIERARTKQRNFVRDYLLGKHYSDSLKDAALVAFVSPDSEDWRFSLVKIEQELGETRTGRTAIRDVLSPAKRWSFLVGKNEKSHTAQSRFLPLIVDENLKISLEVLEEAFNVEVVTKEFFEKYRDLFIKVKLALDKIVKNDAKVRQDFISKKISTVDFSKKLLGQIVFLYFLQKKGWFGVERGKPWGSGPKDFMRKLFNKEFGDYENFYNDILEPLFYEALRTDRSSADHYYSRFNCKIPFLNGGLFDPINNLDWVITDIVLPNELFSNNKKTIEGDIGDGILDVFDRYNFTVNEDEPLEKEVALDPELLGKIYEKLNAIRDDNFDEYVKVLKTGKKGEETKFNKEYGVYYTPREIVHFMCQESLKSYLESELDGKVSKEDIEQLFLVAENYSENEIVALEKQKKIEAGEQKNSKYVSYLPESIKSNAQLIDELLANIKVCDPAVGSGAFPIGMLHEIVKLRLMLSVFHNREINSYDLKRHCIENSLYGVDIDSGAVETCKLRFWLSLIVDEEDFYNIKPLPNLDFKIVSGDSLLSVEKNLFNQQAFNKLEEKKLKFFNETNPLEKQKLKDEINNLIYDITNGHNEFDFQVYFSEVFHKKGGFDIVIANPPYISTKGISEDYKKALMKFYNFADDTYNHFYFKGMEILKSNGILAFISSKTFWTIQTKKNLRELLLNNRILKLFDTANPFDAPMVDTCVILVQKQASKENHIVEFLDGRKSLTNPQSFFVKQKVFASSPNKVFFIPTEYNLRIYERLGKKINELLNTWWDKISTSKNIEKFKKELEEYRKNLNPGDVTLLGLITEGGQGLATANNGKFIGVLEGTKWAEKIRRERPEKLLLASEFCKKNKIFNKRDAQEFLDSLSEQEVRKLFDELKEKYGRDVFGQGWLYRIISKEEIADVNKLTEDEKLNGIKGAKTFVPYDKGDKKGNRWYAPTPYYIDWSRENVKFLKENSGKKGEGMPVVRNPQFYFREGFCWTDVNSTYLKSRIKENGVYDVLTMSLFTSIELPDWYFVCLINSKFMSEYVDDFVNSTSHFQINDARQIPIIIPTLEQLKQFKNLFDMAYNIQKQKFDGRISEGEAEEKLAEVQRELDEMVEEMYMGG